MNSGSLNDDIVTTLKKAIHTFTQSTQPAQSFLTKHPFNEQQSLLFHPFPNPTHSPLFSLIAIPHIFMAVIEFNASDFLQVYGKKIQFNLDSWRASYSASVVQSPLEKEHSILTDFYPIPLSSSSSSSSSSSFSKSDTLLSLNSLYSLMHAVASDSAPEEVNSSSFSDTLPHSSAPPASPTSPVPASFSSSSSSTSSSILNLQATTSFTSTTPNETNPSSSQFTWAPLSLYEVTSIFHLLPSHEFDPCALIAPCFTSSGRLVFQGIHLGTSLITYTLKEESYHTLADYLGSEIESQNTTCFPWFQRCSITSEYIFPMIGSSSLQLKLVWNSTSKEMVHGFIKKNYTKQPIKWELPAMTSDSYLQFRFVPSLFDGDVDHPILSELHYDFKKCEQWLHLFQEKITWEELSLNSNKRHKRNSPKELVSMLLDSLITTSDDSFMNSNQRSDLDFTERLWVLCRESQSLNELQEILDLVVEHLEQGKLLPQIAKSNSTYFADTCRDALDLLRLQPHTLEYHHLQASISDRFDCIIETALERVLEVGFFKLYRDVHFFLTTRYPFSIPFLFFDPTMDEQRWDQLKQYGLMLEQCILMQSWLGDLSQVYSHLFHTSDASKPTHSIRFNPFSMETHQCIKRITSKHVPRWWTLHVAELDADVPVHRIRAFGIDVDEINGTSKWFTGTSQSF